MYLLPLLEPVCQGFIASHGYTSLFGEGRAVEIDVERSDLAISHSKYFGYMALEGRRLRPLELISSQRARFVPVNQQISYLERDNPTVETFGGLKVGCFPADLFDGAGEAREDHVIRQK